MITAEDISNQKFEKAVLGGYEMSGVDKFLLEVSNDIDALQKENAELKRKLVYLAKKVKEYQNSEGELQTAILSAAKVSKNMEKEAEAKSTSILEDAESRSAMMLSKAHAEANRIVNEANESARIERENYEVIRSTAEELYGFIREFCQKQLTQLDEAEKGHPLKKLPAAAAVSAAKSVSTQPATAAAPPVSPQPAVTATKPYAPQPDVTSTKPYTPQPVGAAAKPYTPQPAVTASKPYTPGSAPSKAEPEAFPDEGTPVDDDAAFQEKLRKIEHNLARTPGNEEIHLQGVIKGDSISGAEVSPTLVYKK